MDVNAKIRQAWERLDHSEIITARDYFASGYLAAAAVTPTNDERITAIETLLDTVVKRLDERWGSVTADMVGLSRRVDAPTEYLTVEQRIPGGPWWIMLHDGDTKTPLPGYPSYATRLLAERVAKHIPGRDLHV